MLLLVYVLIFGVVRGGGRRWISLPLFNLQPSEFMKIGLALVLARLFGDSRNRTPNARDLPSAARSRRCRCCSSPGSRTSEPPPRWFPCCSRWRLSQACGSRSPASCSRVALVAAPMVWTVGLQDYQKGRVLTFVNPSRDPLGAGYQQIQARITVGAGGLWGKGFMKGTQGQQGFLPVAHNDFIFSVLAEEHGFIGVLAVLGLYAFVVLRTIETARLARDRLGTLLVVGALASFTFQVFYNVSMSAGLAPVKGLTLPLMSYGGSSVIASLAGIGLVLNVRMRRFTN